MGILADLLGDVAEDLYGNIPNEVKNIYKDDLTQITAPNVSFKPFTVTGSTGSVTGGPAGTTYSLNAQQQNIQNELMRNALSQFSRPAPGAQTSQAAGLSAMGQGSNQLSQSAFGIPSAQLSALQAYGLGNQFMGQSAYAPQDVEALRNQYGTMASQSAMDVLTPTAVRESSVYDRIRATQRPEEERQRLQLEERLYNQGRSGIRTDMYGGTPEQFALSKAQEEAKNSASLAAMQQAQAERQQSLGTAQTLSGMFGQQATLGGSLQAQLAQLGQGYSTLGATQASQSQALQASQQARALQALQTGQQLLSGGVGLESLQQQMGIEALQAGFAPQASLLSALSPALNVASMSDVAHRQQGQYELDAQLANLEGSVGQSQGLANLYGSMFGGAGGLLGSLTGAGGDIASELIKKLPFSDIRLKDNIAKVGELDSGINLYTWEWNEEGKRLAGDTPTFGVLAQEVQKVTPEAVIRGNHGYLMVDYAKLI